MFFYFYFVADSAF